MMDLRTYLGILARRWPLIVGLAALAGATAYLSAVRAPRVYRATAQLSVTPTSIDFFKGEAVQRLLNNYTWQLRSRDFAARIAPAVQPPAAPEALAGKIKAVAAPSEYRIAIEVDDPDPARAQAIANAAAVGFVDLILAEVAGNEKWEVQVKVLDRAELPAAPVSPRPKRDAAGAGILGALLGIGLALLLEFWDDRIKDADEAGSLLAWPVLGVIPRVQGATARPRWLPRPQPQPRASPLPPAGSGSGHAAFLSDQTFTPGPGPGSPRSGQEALARSVARPEPDGEPQR
jgi:receptor protein-tyrosine kinase